MTVRDNGKLSSSRAPAGRKTRQTTLLSALLAVQMVIIALVLLADGSVSGAEDGPLLAFEPEAVGEVRIGATENGAGVVIARDADGWRLADGHPADADKVNDVLNRLADLRAGWPVATSAGSSARFEVAPDAHQRRVVLLEGGDAVADVYLGTSPGYQRVHARRADADSIFSVALANYQLPVRADEWLDKTLLQPRGYLASVTRMGDWNLVRSEDAWLIDGDAADQEAAARFERRLVELRVAGIATAPDPGLEPAAVFEITDPQGPYRLSLYADGSGNDYRVTSDRRAGYFRLSAFLADQLLLDKAALMPGHAAAETAADTP